jgi:hypothetical protein
MLEVALAMAERGVQPKNRVRYVFAGGEVRGSNLTSPPFFFATAFV